MSIGTAEVRPYYFFFFCFGRGTSVARRDQGGSLALAGVYVGADMMQKLEIGDEDSASRKTYLDVSRMYDWKIYIFHKF